MKKTLLALSILGATTSFVANAADYGDDIHSKDYKWMQFNLMHTSKQLPNPQTADRYKDNYLEMEFGGRSGLFDLYGYVDVFDVDNDIDSSKHKNGSNDGQNLFMKFAPRLSLDALTGEDLSFGPVQELYIANLNNIGDQQFESLIGIGADVNVPWFGKVGMNLYSRYVRENQFFREEEGEWNGYQFSMNWFKPFYTFDNGSFISYQGYLDWTFGADTYGTDNHTSSGGAMYNGLYWHSEHYAVGYGLKYFKDIYLTKDDAGSFKMDATGFGHYFSVTYKF